MRLRFELDNEVPPTEIVTSGTYPIVLAKVTARGKGWMQKSMRTKRRRQRIAVPDSVST